MAIQTVDLKVPGGDTPRSANTKINANFTNATHAASRLVGTASGNVATYEGDFGVDKAGYNGGGVFTYLWGDTELKSGFYRAVDNASEYAPKHKGVSQGWSVFQRIKFQANTFADLSISVSGSPRMSIRWVKTGAVETDARLKEWAHVYTTANTTIEENTNYLKVASPILRLQHNDFVKEHEAEKMDIAVENPSVGVYKITGTTGLRNDGTWHFSPPKDEHNNVLCMVEVSEENDVITVNTYKKKFDFETVSIVPDYEQPTDIPEGATVMLRFNDLPADDMPAL